MNDDVLKSAIDNSYSYQEYISLIEGLHQQEKATSFQENKTYYDYSVLGLSRMKRIFKRQEHLPELLSLVKEIDEEQNWIIITESWCGDASQTVPIIAKLVSENPQINLRIVLRDSNLNFMNRYLTNGSISIPILVVFDKEWKELWVWGPRPAEAQEKVMEYKHAPEPKVPYSTFSAEIQKWYNQDKGISTERELLKLLQD